MTSRPGTYTIAQVWKKLLKNNGNFAIVHRPERLLEILMEFRKNNIGFIFQQYYLLQNLNVEKNVRMGADLVSNNDYKNINIVK